MDKDQVTVILQEALRLPQEARAALVASLLESLDEKLDANAETEWTVEIARRIRELDEGLVQPIPWAEARKKILESR